MKFSSYLKTLSATFVLVTSAMTHAAIMYTERATFEAQLQNIIVDDYSNAGYLSGDDFDGTTFDIFTDAGISAVLGETRYQSTGFTDLNFITGQTSSQFVYCSGCNGSFLLDFTNTSIGSALGVFGVGLNLAGSQRVFGNTAFVTFGNGTTANFVVPDAGTGETPFWGLTSDLFISSIHFGLVDGGTNTDNEIQRMALDNLTIGSAQSVPVPAAVSLLIMGLVITALRKRRG